MSNAENENSGIAQGSRSYAALEPRALLQGADPTDGSAEGPEEASTTARVCEQAGEQPS